MLKVSENGTSLLEFSGCTVLDLERRLHDIILLSFHQKMVSILNQMGKMDLPNVSHKVAIIPRFTLESGVTLFKAPIAFVTYGTLAKTRDNVIVVCHGFSVGLEVHEWWSDLLGPGKALDTENYFVICLNSLGSPYGSASPMTDIDGDFSKGKYGPKFPWTTVRDDVRIHKQVLDQLAIKQVKCVVGGSMGGMLALEWAFLGSHYIMSFISIAATSQQGAWAISWNEVQRNTIQADPKFKAGQYPSSDPPLVGLSGARMTALLTYRSQSSYESRFGRGTTRNPQQRIEPPLVTPSEGVCKYSTISTEESSPFLAQTYLRYKSHKFSRSFDANCYISLTRKLDSHDITRGRVSKSSKKPIADALSQLEQPALVIGISSDVLYPWYEQEEMAMGVDKGQYRLMVSSEGHDAFLIHTHNLNAIIQEFLQEVHGAINGNEDEQQPLPDSG